MSRQIKLIWDFRGAAAAKTAEHHEIHLKEYIEAEKLDVLFDNTDFGYAQITVNRPLVF